MRNILKKILAFLAKRVIGRYKPIVIGITGSVGKSTAKEAVFAVLQKRFWVRKNEENFNNEIGVPNAVLGVRSIGSKNASGKLINALQIIGGVLKACWLYCGLRQPYPEILVLELAADRPGDIGHLADTVKPEIGIITAVGEVPVHVEFYASPKEVAEEKSRLISVLPAEGLAILNYDDQTVLDMKEFSRAKVITFGLGHNKEKQVLKLIYDHLLDLKIQNIRDNSNINLGFGEVEANKPRASEIEKYFLDEGGVVDFINNVENQEVEGGASIKVTFASQNTVKDRTGNFGVPIVIELIGSWEEIDANLQKIDKLPYLFRPANVEIAYSEEGPLVVVFKYGVFLYVRESLGQNR